MRIFYVHQLYFIIFLSVSWLNPFISAAQQLKQFQGEFKTPYGDKGSATFSYQDKKGERIKEGPFVFKTTYLDSTDSNHFIKLQFKGNYQDNLKEDLWSFQLTDYEVEIQDIINMEVVSQINARQNLVRGTYSQGLPHGAWSFRQEAYNKSKLKTIRKSSEATLEEGHFAREFVYEDRDSARQFSVKGFFDQQGYFDSLWTVTYQQDTATIREYRRYQHGFLLHLKKVNADSNQVTDSIAYTSVIEKLAALHQPDSLALPFRIHPEAFGVAFDMGYAPEDARKLGQKQGNQLIRTAIDQYYNTFARGRFSKDEPLVYPAATRRFYFPLSEEDEKHLTNAITLLTSMRDSINLLLDNTSLKINHQKNDSTAFAYQYFLTLKEKAADAINVLDTLTNDTLRVIDPALLLESSLTFLQPVDLITYEFDGEEKSSTVRYDEEAHKRINTLEGLEKYLRGVDAVFTQLKLFTKKELRSIENNLYLQALEKQISSQIDQIDSLYQPPSEASDTSRITDMHLYLYKKFGERQRNLLTQAYSNEESFTKKQELATQIIQLLEVLENIYAPLASIPAYREKVDEAYTEVVFDPYTFNPNFRKRIKKRLYDRAAIELYDYLVAQLKQQDDYTQLQAEVGRLIQLHERLLALSEKNTQTIEKRLRRQDDPERIMELIALD